MPRKIVSTGRGGAGKSTFVALMSQYLKPPSLLIDLDPDLSLADMLGIDFHTVGKRTIVEALYDAVGERQAGKGSPLIPVEDHLESLIWSDCLYEGDKFDLITLGTKDLEGCYCFPDHLVRKAISHLAKNYTNVAIDSPAGLEHLNRNIVSDIDDLFIILDPSEKSLKHIKRVKDIINAVGIRYNHLYLVANYMFDETSLFDLELDSGLTLSPSLSVSLRAPSPPVIPAKAGISLRMNSTKDCGPFLGKIDYDAKLEDYNLKGKSLRELPEDSPACLSVKKILAKARLI